MEKYLQEISAMASGIGTTSARVADFEKRVWADPALTTGECAYLIVMLMAEVY